MRWQCLNVREGVGHSFHIDTSTLLPVEAACVKHRGMTDTLQQQYRREHVHEGLEE